MWKMRGWDALHVSRTLISDRSIFSFCAEGQRAAVPPHNLIFNFTFLNKVLIICIYFSSLHLDFPFWVSPTTLAPHRNLLLHVPFSRIDSTFDLISGFKNENCCFFADSS